MTNYINYLKQKLLYGIAVCTSLSNFYAASTAVGQGVQKFSGSVLKEIAAVYCDSLWLLLWGLNWLGLAFIHNDKITAVLKKSIWIIPLVYIILQVLVNKPDILKNTADTAVNWF